MAALVTEDNETVFWPLEEFAVGEDLRSTNPTNVFVDRTTQEFGIVYFHSDATATVEKFPDTHEPIFFSAKDALAACWHNKCKKISILYHHVQINLVLQSASEARGFLDAFEDATGTTQNISFCTYEHHSLHKFRERSFSMAKEKIGGRVVQHWMDAHAPSSEWPSLRKTGEWSDFTIIAGDRSFAVHRVKLCKESDYFKAICNGGFAEADHRWVKLPEPEHIIDILLDEMYDTYNNTTGSLFTGFVLRSELEKERMLKDLLDIFIAADKYNLEKIKMKVAKATTDRLPFIHDVLTLVDFASCIFDEQSPQVDRGLRKAILSQLHARMPSIIKDQAAWEEYTDSKVVMRAFHAHVFDGIEPVSSHNAGPSSQCLSPPVTPIGGKRKRPLSAS
ncbi:BTB/POZ domain-containing protein [Stagonosporopsis vannaccii]|nr:BTB/POZ domain-containing protein [Stagonosporopsis vannaccii]